MNNLTLNNWLNVLELPGKQQSSSSVSSKSGMKERDLALLRGDLMLAQAAAQGAYHAAVAAAQKGKVSKKFTYYASDSSLSVHRM